MKTSTARRDLSLVGLALALVLLGGGLAGWVQTDGGNVSVRDVRINGSDGLILSGLLYVPETASAESPAPAVLAVHGYMNSREAQGPFAIELARRGYVTLALDQSGHGFSDAPGFADGFGGPPGLAYLRSLDFVDTDNIGLTGHSMGTWAALAATAAFPDGYASVVIQASTPGFLGAPEGTPTEPRNTALVLAEWEELSMPFWGVPTGAETLGSDKLMAMFDTDRPVEEGRIYGSIDDGTARVAHLVRTIHPGVHWSPTATSLVIDWFDQTLDGGTPASGQTWVLKELGTLVAMAGGILFVFAGGSLLLGTPFFGRIRRSVPAARGLPAGPHFWLGAVIATTIPAVTFFYLQAKGQEWVEPNAWFPQGFTNGVMVWALGVAAIALGLMALWHLALNRRAGGSLRTYGVSTEGGTLGVIGRAALLALTLGVGVYALLVLSDLLFLTDFRLWIWQLHLIDASHIQIYLAYLLPFAVFFVAIGTVLHGQFRSAGPEPSLLRATATNAFVLMGGIAVLIAAHYLPMLLGGTLLVDTQPIIGIVAGFQIIPTLILVAAITTYFFRLTGTVYPGAFISAVFVTWTVTAGQATQYPVAPWDGGGMVTRVVLPLLVGVALLVLSAVALRRGRQEPEPSAPGERTAGDSDAGDGAAGDSAAGGEAAGGRATSPTDATASV